MISQQMQAQNTLNTIESNALTTSRRFYGLATHRQAISVRARVKTAFIDVRAAAPCENIFSPLPSRPADSRCRSLSESASEWPPPVLMRPRLDGSFQTLIYGGGLKCGRRRHRVQPNERTHAAICASPMRRRDGQSKHRGVRRRHDAVGTPRCKQADVLVCAVVLRLRRARGFINKFLRNPSELTNEAGPDLTQT